MPSASEFLGPPPKAETPLATSGDDSAVDNKDQSKSASAFLGPPPRGTLPSVGDTLTSRADDFRRIGSAAGKILTDTGSTPGAPHILPPLLAATRKNVANIRGRMQDDEATYDEGLPFGVRAQLSASDTVKGDLERKGVIEKYMPGAQIAYDKGGRMMVKPKGAKKFIWAEGGGFWSGLAADVVGNNMPVAGGIAALGAVAPEMGGLAALGPAGEAGATALGLGALYMGGFAGKSADEVRKSLEGLWHKSSATEELKTLERGGEQAIEGELTGKVISKAAGVVKQYPKMFGGQTKESKQTVEDMLKRGYRPSLEAAAPESTRPPYVQRTIEKMTKSIRNSHNAQALENDVRSTLGMMGFSRDEQDHVLEQILSGRVDAREYGETIAKTARAYKETAEAALADGRDALKTRVDGDVEKLTKSMGDADPALLEKIQNDIALGKIRVSNAYRSQYEGVWKLSGNEAKFSTASIRKAASDLLKSLPPTAKAEIAEVDPEIVKDLDPFLQHEIEAAQEARKGQPQGEGERIFIGQNKEILTELTKIARLAPDITPQQAHVLRSQFLALERDGDFAKNFAGYSRGALTRALEEGFDQLETKIPGFTKQLREINQGYRAEIAKYDNATVQTIMRDARQSGSVAPERVLSFVKDPNNMREILAVVSPETKAKIVATDFADALRAATDPQSGVIDGRAFAKQMKAREKMGPVLYGRRFTDAQRLANKYAHLDGQLKGSEIGALDADFVGTMEKVVRSEDELQKSLVASGKWLTQLGQPGVMGERAIKMTVAPGAESRTIEAFKFYKPGSPELNAAKKYALVKLFADAADSEGKTIADAISNGKLKEAWGKWTPKQKELLFGDMAPEIDGLVRRVNALQPKNAGTEIAGGLAAGSVNLGGLATYPITAMAMIGDYLFSRPAAIRWFAGTLGTPTAEWANGAPERLALQRALQIGTSVMIQAPGTAVEVISHAESQAKKDQMK